MRVRDSRLCSAAFAEKQKPTPGWLSARLECDSRCHVLHGFFLTAVFLAVGVFFHRFRVGSATASQKQ